MLRFTPKQNGTASGSTAKFLEHTVVVEAKAEEIYSSFVQGKYDQFIFGETPILTDELKFILLQYNRDFIQRLFTKCTSDKNLAFWLNDAGAKLPKDTWALAVNLGNNIVVFRYLKNHEWFDRLSKEDKDGLLKRADRFPGEGLEYLKAEFGKKICKAAF